MVMGGGVDFIIYDNKFTFEKHCIYNGNPLSRIPIVSACLPEHGAFWFYTDMKKEVTNVNIHAPYVHLHPGILNNEPLQFKNDPIEIKKTGKLSYNPKTKNLEVRNSRWPWSKPMWTKNCKYYGEMPLKITSALGPWYFDSYKNIIYITLSYFSEPKSFVASQTSD